MRTGILFLAGSIGLLAQGTDWVAMGKGGSVQPKDKGVVFGYELQPGQMALAVRPTPDGVAQMSRLRLRVKSSQDTSLAVVLSERKPGGGNYSAVFWAPANAWQAVEFTPADFALGDGRNDPVDADGRLDLDQVEGVAVLDVAQFLVAQPENSEVPIAMNRPRGARSIEIADFEIVTGGAGGAAQRKSIDAFDRGFLEWMTPGGVTLAAVGKANPLQAPAMRARFDGGGGKFGVAMRRMPSGDFSKAERVVFDVASERETTMVVSVEMRNGKRFNQTVFPPGKSEPFHVRLQLAEFEGEGTFDPAQWKSIAIADASGEANTLVIARLSVE